MTEQFGLTPLARKLLAFIREQAAISVSPTVAEMAAALGLRSKSSVSRVLNQLEDRGHVQRMRHRARSVQIVESDSTSLTPATEALLARYCEETGRSQRDVLAEAIFDYISYRGSRRRVAREPNHQP